MEIMMIGVDPFITILFIAFVAVIAFAIGKHPHFYYWFDVKGDDNNERR